MKQQKNQKEKIHFILSITFICGLLLSSCTMETAPSYQVLQGETDIGEEWLQRDVVKLAAGQVNNDDNKYQVMLEYIDRAGDEGADLIALPEYIAGTFASPPKDSDPVMQIAEAARRNNIYLN